MSVQKYVSDRIMKSRKYYENKPKNKKKVLTLNDSTNSQIFLISNCHIVFRNIKNGRCKCQVICA